MGGTRQTPRKIFETTNFLAKTKFPIKFRKKCGLKLFFWKLRDVVVQFGVFEALVRLN